MLVPAPSPSPVPSPSVGTMVMVSELEAKFPPSCMIWHCREYVLFRDVSAGRVISKILEKKFFEPVGKI